MKYVDEVPGVSSDAHKIDEWFRNGKVLLAENLP